MTNNTMSDTTLQVVINLMHELWVVKDRAAMLEQVLVDEGINVKDKVDRLVPDGELAAQLDEERKAFINRVLEPTLNAGNSG